MRHAFLSSIEIPENRENAFKLFRNIDYGFESCIKQFLYFKCKLICRYFSHIPSLSNGLD